MMQEKGIDQLAPDSRVWIFQSSKVLTGELERVVGNEIRDFLNSWSAHGTQLYSGFEIRYHRFIIIAVNENVASASGCSIDSLIRMMQVLDQKHDLKLFDRLKVAYRDGHDIVECHLNEFRKRLADGLVNSETKVFNSMVMNIRELESNWETTVAQSWHANLVP